ncbi:MULTISPECIES: hypothetical protein [unclassified Sphingobium]|uniref:hypothetical protein n=1 Tax=unclassified Sphingobium TaxID=2611147 RepID=UPI0005CC345C|nr:MULTISPECIES: hypothetical protein [unclassified Sphingobium]AJR26895.1 hypothetical protein TZ53_24085 [Sphingobium sp. YBL2]QPI75451.1 hypothetical protein IZV00_20130 [Sphingobium sp. Cam5-1]
MSRKLPLALAAVLGLGSAANGLFMLASPANWYFAVPGVTTTGPFNQHFVRDIGLIFLLVAIAMLAGVARPVARVPLWSAAALWLAGHALFHFWEVAVGIRGPSALAQDFPAVTLPAIVTTVLALWAWRDAKRSRRTHSMGDSLAAQ